MQLLAVYAAMKAFGIDAPLPAAGLVLVLMNIATIVPLWPGNVGLVQAAVALPLRNYGVPYATGFASVSRRSCFEVVPEAMSAWNPEHAPQAIVMKSMGKRVSPFASVQPVKAG